MLKFVFILTLHTAEGGAQSYVQGANMTGAECVAAIETYVADGMGFGQPSCEPYVVKGYTVEHEGERIELPECLTEDSENCVWDAMNHGNGMGQSFYTLGGEVFYLD